jgi:lipooligosaccharide transport system permease protein
MSHAPGNNAATVEPPTPIIPKVPSWLYGIYSVWSRHAILYRRTWLINFLPPVTEPIFYLLAFGFGLSPMVGEFMVGGQKMSYLKYIGPAMIAVGVCFQSFFEGAYGSFIRLRFQRTWHGLLTGPLGFREIFFGDYIWACTRGAIAGLVTGVVVLLLGQITFTGLLFTLPMILLGSMMFSGIGLLTAGFVKTIDHINVPVFLFLIPMFTFSGTFFPRDNLPPILGHIAGSLPLAQLVDLIRLPIVYDPTWPIDLAGLITWTFVTTAIAYRIIHGQVFR